MIEQYNSQLKTKRKNKRSFFNLTKYKTPKHSIWKIDFFFLKPSKNFKNGFS